MDEITQVNKMSIMVAFNVFSSRIPASKPTKMIASVAAA
jgi:hypothetical protein